MTKILFSCVSTVRKKSINIWSYGTWGFPGFLLNQRGQADTQL